uniref:Macro domain-containing protein n=1 Tax=Eutreptiella gymnastica TaxID=73025 RepID=A0A7S4GJA2_9EUGL
MVFDNKFEAHALHDKQVIKMPVTNKNRKLFLGRHNITAKPKTVPKEALVITETRTGLRLVVLGRKAVTVTREDGTHTLQTDDECDIHNGDAVDVVAGLPYSFRIVYTDPVQSKSLRRGQKKEVEVPDFAPMQTTIAFPSLSTGTFSYDADKAVPVVLDTIEAWLKEHKEDNIKLLLVESVKSYALHQFEAQWKARDGDPRFATLHANILKLGTNEKLSPAFIVDPANANFNVVKGLNRFVHIEGAPHLLPDTLAMYGDPPPETGVAYPVRVRKGVSLYGQGARYVLHVIGPNMNPCWPDCLKDDYEQGDEVLKQSYKNLLDTYYAIAFKGLEVPDLEPEREPEPEPTAQQNGDDADAKKAPPKKKKKLPSADAEKGAPPKKKKKVPKQN